MSYLKRLKWRRAEVEIRVRKLKNRKVSGEMTKGRGHRVVGLDLVAV